MAIFSQRMFLFFSLFLLLALPIQGLAGDKVLTPEDLMRFREIDFPLISEDGLWLAYSSVPDRGDPEGVLISVPDQTQQRIPHGGRPTLAKQGGWVSFVLEPGLLATEKAKKDKKAPKPEKGVVLLHGPSKEHWQWEQVKSSAFSDDGLWFVRLHSKLLEETTTPEPESETGKDETKAEDKQKDKSGTTLVLRSLASGNELIIHHVDSYALDPAGKFLVYGLKLPDGAGNGLFYRQLDQLDREQTLVQADKLLFSPMKWSEQGQMLAFVQYPQPESKDDKNEKEKKAAVGDGSLYLWKPGQDPKRIEDLPEGTAVPHLASLTWTHDGKRLFFGLLPVPEVSATQQTEKELTESDLFDLARLRDQKELDVWHGRDPYIKTHSRKIWEEEQQKSWLAVYHLDSDKSVALTRDIALEIVPDENPFYLPIKTDLPYRRSRTWLGDLYDFSVVDLRTGKQIPVVQGVEKGVASHQISPKGTFVAWQEGDRILLKTLPDGQVTQLAQNPLFLDEDHDYPSPVPNYGLAQWLEDESGFYGYDKFDIWFFPVDGTAPQNITGGRTDSRQFRISPTDPRRAWLRKEETLLLTSYHDLEKTQGFYGARVGKSGIERLVEGKKNYSFIAKPEKADLILFTREDFSEFPDLQIADLDFSNSRKLTEENPQIKDFSWGKPELVSWRSANGQDLQGVLIKPGGYQEGKRYPVLVYFYRFMSQKLYAFNQMAINHRPNLPFYSSNGYAVFLPDVRFKVGNPGPSSVQALVPGVQKLIDLGIADPKAIGLHGHSWSGYQAAYIATQTDFFACVIAGAPVANMTSAYSGIRLGTGLARQFQYEMGQSRIGATLWERRDLYIDNSPLFFADRIHTPMMIEFGDIDDAVPWQQGLELYLALRRLDRDVVLLQYHGEPHHLKKYPNKVDYTLKMKEYLDHYLKGEPAPAWLAEGVPYSGD